MKEDSPHDLLVWPSRHQTVADMLAREPGSSRGLPLDKPLLVWRGPGYKPRAQFSPSGLALAFGGPNATGCLRAFWFRYMMGIKEYAFPWAVAAKLAQPPKKNTPEGRALTRVYNKRMGSALGKEVHSILEGYYKRTPGFERRLRDSRPGRVALSGLGLLPHPRDCARVYIEQRINIDQSELNINGKPVAFIGYKDLVAVSHERELLLADYKTTSSRDWIKTPADLLIDDQANSYALDTMQRFDVDALDLLWIYFLTRGRPWADGVPVRITREHAVRHVRGMVLRASALREKMHSKDIEQFTPNAEHCPAFAGCPLSAKAGGPCKFTPRAADRYRALCSSKPIQIGRKSSASATVPTKEAHHGIQSRTRQAKRLDEEDGRGRHRDRVGVERGRDRDDGGRDPAAPWTQAGLGGREVKACFVPR